MYKVFALLMIFISSSAICGEKNEFDEGFLINKIEVLASDFYVRCGGYNYVIPNNGKEIFEYNGVAPKAVWVGKWKVSEADQLNDLIWHGKGFVDLGKSVRKIYIEDQDPMFFGPRETVPKAGDKSTWNTVHSGIEFEFVLYNGKWKVRDGASVMISGASIDLKPALNCEKINLYIR